MLQNNKGFSIIEVVIATSIISITVFGVYKLMGENNKIINNSSNYLQVNSLFPLIQECIDNKINIFSLNSGDQKYYYLNNNLIDCQILSTNSGTIIDNIEYNLSSKVIDKSTDFADWELIISSDETKTMTGFYKQIKK